MGCQETSRPPAGFELRYSYTPTVGKNNDEAARRREEQRRETLLRTADTTNTGSSSPVTARSEWMACPLDKSPMHARRASSWRGTHRASAKPSHTFLAAPARARRRRALRGREQRVRRLCGACSRVVHHHRGADRRHRPVLARAHPAREVCSPAPPSAAGRDQDALSAVARVRRDPLAARVALGLHEARDVPDGVRPRQARRLLREAWPAGADATSRRRCTASSDRVRHEIAELEKRGDLPTALAALRERLAELEVATAEQPTVAGAG